ncbi:MAG TPA: hypothetical protein VFM54_24370 [Micromonosporaceae bacterium]|nr:hypothetical protein [Micromonosporaceae bacterium]
MTTEELRRYLGYPSFDAEQAARAQMLLDDAQALIEGPRGAGQKLELSTDTVTLDGTGTDRLLLPRWPVTAMVSVTVTEDDETVQVLVDEVDYTWSAAGILTRVGGLWPREPRSVAVVYTPGYSTMPSNIKRICRRLAASAWRNTAGATVQEIGDSRVRWAAPGGELTTGELEELAAYRARP